MDPNNGTPNNNQPTEETTDNGFKGYLDPISIRTSNGSFEDAYNNGYQVVPMNLSDSWDVNKNNFPTMDILDYKKFVYDPIMSEELQQQKQKFDLELFKDPDYSWIKEVSMKAHQRGLPGVPTNTHPSNWGIPENKRLAWSIYDGTKTEGQIGKSYQNGSLRKTMTDDQIFDSKNVYYNPITGKKGNLNDYKMANKYGSPFRVDEFGQEWMLVKDTQAGMWAEVAADSVIEGNQVRSMWTPQDFESGAYEHAIDMSFNTIVDMAYTQWGTAAEAAGSIYNWMFGGEDINSWQRWGRTMQNYGNASKSKISEAAESESMFDSYRAFLGVTSSAITQAGAQLLIGRLTGGAGNALQALGRGGVIAQKMISGAPWLFGSIYAANAMNEEAKAAGLSDDDRMSMSLLAAGAVFVAELGTAKLLGASGIADGFKSKGSQKAIMNNLRNKYNGIIAKELDKFVGPSATNATKEIAKKNAWGRMMQGANGFVKGSKSIAGKAINVIPSALRYPLGWAYSKAPKSIIGRFRAAGAAGWEEGWEEVFEGQMNTWTKQLYNNGYIGFDGPTNNAEPGKGLFQNTKYDHYFQDFVGGFIGGGFTGGIMGGRYKRDFIDHTVAELVASHDSADEAIKKVSKMHENGSLNLSTIGVNDEFITAFNKDEQNKIKSRNDVAFENLIEEIKIGFQIKEVLGLTSAEKIAKVMGNDMELVKDTIENALSSKKLETEITLLKSKLEGIDESNPQYAQIKKELDDAQNAYNVKNNVVNKIMNGEAIAEYRAHMAAREFITNDELNKKRLAALSINDQTLRKQALQNIFDNAIESAEQRDLWEDKVKAIELVRKGKSYAETYKKILEQIEEGKKESKTLSDITDFNFDVTDNVQFNQFIESLAGKYLLENDFGNQFKQIQERISQEKENLEQSLNNKYNVDVTVEDESSLDSSILLPFEWAVMNEAEENKLQKARELQDQVFSDPEFIKYSEIKDNENIFNSRYATLQKDKDYKYIPAGGVDQEGMYSILEDRYLDEVETENNYVAIDTKNNTLENINKSDYESIKKQYTGKIDSTEDTESFIYDGKKYAKINTGKAIVNGKTMDGSAIVDQKRSYDFYNVNTPMRSLLEQGDYIGTERIDDIFKEIINEFERDKIVSPEMVEKLNKVKKHLDEKDTILELVDFVKSLDNDGLITEHQRNYFGIDGFDMMGDGIEAYIAQHNINKSRYKAIKIELESKADREGKMQMLDEKITKMFGHIANQLNKLIPGIEPVEVNGVVINPPDILSPDADRATVIKAMQYWHYYVNNLDSNEIDSFVENFKLFWHVDVQRMAAENGQIKPGTYINNQKYTFPKAENQGMFQEDFDSMLDDMVFEGAYGVLMPNTNKFRELFYYNTINMIFNTDVAKYYESMINNVLQKIDDPSKVDLSKMEYSGDHTAEQLLLTMFGYTHMNEGYNRKNKNKEWVSMLDSIKNIMKVGTYENADTDAVSLYPRAEKDVNGTKVRLQDASHILDNAFAVFGSGGVGKTSFFVKTMVNLANDFEYEKIILVAPNLAQVDALKKVIPNGMEKMFETLVIEDFLPKQDSYNDSLIFIDEISLLSIKEKNTTYFNGKLSTLEGKKVQTQTGINPINKSNTIFLLGDELQAPFSIDEEKKSPTLSKYAQHGFTLTAVKRTSFVDIYKIQNAFRSESVGQKTKIPKIGKLKYSNDNGVLKGVKLNNDQTSFMNEAMKAVNDENGYIIVYNEKQYDSIVHELPIDKHNRVFYMTNKNKSPQGRTLDGEVYVYMPYEELSREENEFKNNPKYYNRYMLTAVGRAKTFVSVYTGDGLNNETSELVDVKELSVFETDDLSTANRMKELYDNYNNVLKDLINVPQISKENEIDEKENTEETVEPVIVTEEEVTETEDTTEEQEEVTDTEETVDESETTQDQDALNKAMQNAKNLAKKRSRKNKAKTKKQKEKQSVYDYENDKEQEPLSSEDFVVEYGSAGKPLVGIEKRILESDGNEISAVVSKSGFIAKVGAKYTDNNGKESIVTAIEYNEDEETYLIRNDRTILPINLTEFEEKYALPTKQKAIEDKTSSLTHLVTDGTLTLFGNTFTSNEIDVTSNNKKTISENFKNYLIDQITFLSNNPSLTVNLVISKKKTPFYDFKGVMREKDVHLKLVVSRGKHKDKVISYHFLNNKDYKYEYKVSAEEKNYNDWLFDLLKDKKDGDIIAENVPFNSDNILSDTALGFDVSARTEYTKYNELVDLVSKIGYELEGPHQVKESVKDDTGKEGEKSKTVFYVSKNKFGKKREIFVSSMKFNQMDTESQNRFIKNIEDLIRTSNSILEKGNSAQGYENILSNINNFFYFNAPEITALHKTGKIKNIDLKELIGISKQEANEGVKDATIKSKAKSRIQFLEDILNDLDSEDGGVGLINNLRMPTLIDKSNKNFVTNPDILIANSKVYPKMPVIKLDNMAENLGINPERESKLFRLYENSLENEEYNVLLNNLKSEITELLGEGISLQFFNSDNIHGFVNKFGEIGLNLRNGFGRMKTIYHEATHYASEFLMTKEARERLFDEIASKNPKYSNWRNNLDTRIAIAEKLADDAERYQSDRRNLKGISKFMHNAYTIISKYLRNLFGIKRAVDDFYTDLFILKKYRNKDYSSLTPEIQEIDIDFLYSKNKNIVTFDKVQSAFYNRDVARSAADLVSNVMYNEAIGPSLNNRLFKDSSISFNDMINRAEWAMRERVMFEFTADGIKTETKVIGNYTAKNLPVLRSLYIPNNKGNYVPLFNWAVNPKDSTGMPQEGLHLMYYNTESNKYEIAPLSDKNVYFYDDYDKKNIRKSIRKALQQYKIESAQGSVRVLDSTDEGKLKLSTIEESDREFYRSAMTMIDDVFAGMINRDFPFIDVKSKLNKFKKVTFSDIADYLNKVSDANIKLEAEQVNPVEKQSYLMKLIIRNTPVFYVNENGNQIKTNRKINPIIADGVMNDVAGMFWAQSKTGKSAIDNFKTNLLDKISARSNVKQFNAGMMSSMVNDEELIALNSVYQSYFADYNPKNPSVISHYAIMKWRDDLLSYERGSETYNNILDDIYENQYKKVFSYQQQNGVINKGVEPLTKSQFAATVKNRAYHSEMILNAIVSYYGSITKNTYSKVKIFGQKENARMYHYEMQKKGTEDFKQSLENHINATIFQSDNLIADRYLDLFGFNKERIAYSPVLIEGQEDKNPSIFYMKEDGIYLKYDTKKVGKEFKLFGIQNNKFLPVDVPALETYLKDLEINSAIGGKNKRRLIQDLFNHFFNYEMKDNNVLNKLTEKKIGTDFVGIEDIHNIFGPLILSTYTYAAEKTYENPVKDAPRYSTYVNTLQDFASNKGRGENYGRVSDIQLEAGMSEDINYSDTKGDSKERFYPTGFYDEINSIANLLAIRSFDNTIRSLSGKKIYTVNTKDTMGRLLDKNNNAAVEVFADMLNSTNGIHENHNARGMNPINPIFGKRDFMSERITMLGIEGTSTYAELDNMTIVDNAMADMTNFLKNINASPESFEAYKTSLPFFNQAQRTRQGYSNINFNIRSRDKLVGSNGLLVKTKDSVKLDYKNIMNHIWNRFAMAEEAQVNSINKWIRLLNALKIPVPVEISQVNTNVPGWKNQRDTAFNFIKNIVETSDFNIVDGNVIEFQSTNELYSGIDYILIKNSDGSYNVKLGYETTMMNDVKLPATIENKQSIFFTPQKIYNYGVYNSDITIENIITDTGEEVSIPLKFNELLDAKIDDNYTIKIDDAVKGNIDYTLTEENLKDIVDTLYSSHYNEVSKILYNNSYKIKRDDGFISIPEDVEIRGIKYKNDIVPEWKAFIIGTEMMNAYYENAFEGTEAVEMDNVLDSRRGGYRYIKYNQNSNKRRLITSSTGIFPSVDTYSGINKIGKRLYIADLKTNASINTAYDIVSDEDHIINDGGDIKNPIFMNHYYNSFGGNRGSANLGGGLKTVGLSVNLKTGRIEKLKHASNFPTETLYNSSPFMNKLFKIMLNPLAKPYSEDASILVVDNKPAFMYYDDLNSLGDNDSVLQRFYIIYDNTSTAKAVQETINNIVNKTDFESVEDLIENVYKTEAKKNEWNDLEGHGLPLGQYYFLEELLKNGNLSNYLVKDEFEKDWNEAIRLTTENYNEIRNAANVSMQENPNEVTRQVEIFNRLQMIDAVENESTRKSKAQRFAIPVKTDIGASNKDENGVYNKGVPMPYWSPEGEIHDNLFDLWDAHLNRGGMPQEIADMMLQEFDNSSELLQLNANRPIDDTEESPIVQAMSVILSNPNMVESGKSKEMSEQLSKLINIGLKDMITRLSISEGMSAEDVAKQLNLQDSTPVSGLSQIEEKKIENFVKSKIKASMASTDDSTLLSVIINDEKININVAPGAVTRVVQYLSSFIKKEAVKRKVEAVRLAQMSGNDIMLYELKETGEVFMKSAAEKHANALGKSVEELFDIEKQRSLKHTTVKQKEGNLSNLQLNILNDIEELKMSGQINDEQYYKLKMQKLQEWDLIEVESGEAIIPATKFEKYNIPKTMGLNEIFRLYLEENGETKDINLRDYVNDFNALKNIIMENVQKSLVFTLGTTKVSKKPYINVKYSDNMVKGKNKYFDLMFVDGANQRFVSNRMNIINETNKKYEEIYGRQALNNFINGDYTNENDAITSKDNYEKLLNSIVRESFINDFISEQIETYAKAIKAVHLSTTMNIGMRTPSGPGSGFVANVVGFANDNGSVGFINTIKNLIDGSDQDIDQFTMYYTADTLVDMGIMSETEYNKWKTTQLSSKNESKISDVLTEEGNMINNKLLGMVKDYYLDPKNTNFTLSPINLDSVKKTAEKAYKDIFSNGDLSHNYGHSLLYRKVSMDGKAVGPFALAQKVQTLLYSAYHSNGKNGLSNDIFPFALTKEQYEYVPIWMEMLVNAATDNPKILALGALNVNISNADFVSSLFFASDEILEHINQQRIAAGKEAYTIRETALAIFDFLKSDAHKQVYEYIEAEGNMVDGGYRKSFFENSVNFYSSLSENYNKNVEQAKVLDDNRSSLKDNFINTMKELEMNFDEFTDILSLPSEETEDKDYYTKLFYAIKNKKINDKLVAKAKAKHLALKAIIDAEIGNEIGEDNLDSIKKKINSILEGNKLSNSYDLYSELKSDKNATVESAKQQSDYLSEVLSKLIKAKKDFVKNEKDFKRLSKKTDENFNKDAFLIAKYGMLSEWMKNTIKIANINQFNIGNTYDIMKFEKQVKFSTGYSIDELVSIFDDFTSKKGKNKTLTPNQYFEQYRKPKSFEEVRLNAFYTKRHELAQNDKKWMFKDLTYEDNTINFYNDFHRIGNLAELILARPDIVESLRAVQYMKEVTNNVFISRHKDINELHDIVMDELGYDLWSEEKHNTFYEEINKFFISDYLSSSEENSLGQRLNNALKAYDANDRFLYGSINNGMLADASNPIRRTNYLKQFPIFFMNTVMPDIKRKIENKEVELNQDTIEFLDRISKTRKNTFDWLEVQRSSLASPSEIEMLRNGFNALPSDIKTMLVAYQLIKDGFDYQKSFFGQLMPVEEMRMYSNFIDNNINRNRNFKGRQNRNTGKYNGFENLIYRILSNPNLGLLRNERFIEKTEIVDGKEVKKRIGVAPVSANGLVRFYNKTIQKKYFKNRVQRTKAMVETFEMNGVSIVKGGTTSQVQNNVINFNEIIDIVSDDLNTVREFSLDGQTVTTTMNPFAYIRYIIHGHAQKDIDKLKTNALKELQSTDPNIEFLAPETIESIINKYITDKDFNKNSMSLKGIPRLNNKETYLSEKSNIDKEMISLLKETLIVTAQKKNIPLEDYIGTLYGKVIADKYYSGDLSLSYYLYAMMNSISQENFTLDKFMQINTMPSAEDIDIGYIEGPAYRNRNGLIGNYHDNSGAISSKSVVKLYNKNDFGKGRKLNWYQFMVDSQKLTGSAIESISNNTLAKILIAKSFGLSDENTVSIAKLTSVQEGTQGDIVTLAENTFYSHLDVNITVETNNKHAKTLKDMRKIFEQSSNNVKTVEDMLNNQSLLNTLTWQQKIPYEVGDIIYFQDGTEGVVVTKSANEKSVKYFLKYNEGIDNVFIPKSYTHKSIMSLENIISETNARKSLDGFLQTISRSMPNVEYLVINDEEAEQISRSKKESVSFFQDGVVYINKDRADSGVALHEFAHPLVYAIRENNKPLFDRMSELVTNSPVMDFVIENYSDDILPEDMIMEAIPTYIQMRYYSRFRNELTSEEAAVFDLFFNEIKNIFKELTVGPINFETSLDEIDFSAATMNQISDAILNDMMKGKVLSEIDSRQLRRIVPYTMRASTSSKLKNININNLDQLFQQRASYDESTAIKRSIRRMINTYKNYEGISGTYDLTANNKMFYDSLGRYSDSLRNQYINDVAEKEFKAYEKIDERTIFFMDKLKELNPLAAARETLFASWENRYDLKNADEAQKIAFENKVIHIMDKLGYNPKHDKAMKLEDAMQALGVKLPTNIKNKNTIVIIHNYNAPNQMISILSTVEGTLENYGASEKSTLGESYMSDEMDGKRHGKKMKGVYLNNTNSEIESLKNAIITMAIKKQNPNIKVRTVGAMKVSGDDIKVHKRNVEDILPQIKKIFNDLPQLKESLERDFYDIVTDESLYDERIYKLPLLDKLDNYFRTLLNTNEISDNFKKSIDKSLEQIRGIKDDKLFSNYDALQRSVRSRIYHLGTMLGSIDRRANNEEYQYLLKLYRELTGYKEVNTKFVNDITLDEKLFGTADRWDGQVRTWVYDQIDLAKRKSVEEALPFVKEMNQITKDFDKFKGYILSSITDNSKELFKNIFKKKIIKDKKGNNVEISLHELHWDENDIDTAKALANNEISREELAIGKYIADNLYNEFVNYVMVTERGTLNNKITDGEDSLRYAAEIEVNRRYKKGMLPVFRRSSSAALSENKLKEAFDIYMKSAGNWYGGNLFEEYMQSNESDLQYETFKKLLSPFWSQFQSSIDYGSEYRLKLLGLDFDGENIVLMNQKSQDEMSFNLENIFDFTMLASMRSKHMQQGVVSVNIAMDMLRGEEATRGKNTKDIREHLENYVNRQIYGNMPSLSKMLVEDMALNVDSVLDGTGKIINMIHLALNVKLGAKNAIASGSKLIINALVNSLAGRKDFNIATVTRAAQEIFLNPKKVEALNKKYQIVNVNERDLINHWQNVHTKRNLAESDMQMFMHFIGDHYSQLVGAMAQMMSEGVYDAHDDQGNYDYKKDTRFYRDNGEIGIMGKAMYDSILEQQYKEGYHIPEDGKTLTHAYSQRDENRVKVHVQRFVGELNDTSYKNMITSYGVARAVMSLKSYIFNVAQAWWKRPYQSVQTGSREVFMNDGNPEVDWVPELTEGMIQTLIYSVKGLRKAANMDFSDYENMSSYQKRNIVSMATFTAIVAGVYLLADLLMYDKDDDEKKKKKYRYETDPKTGKRRRVYESEDPEWIGTRLVSMLYDTKYVAPVKDESLTYLEQLLKYITIGAINEQLSYVSPARPIQDMLETPNPYVWQSKNVGELLFNLMALPWTIKNEGVQEGISETVSSLSKNMPFGNMYRSGQEAVDGIMNYLDNETK